MRRDPSEENGKELLGFVRFASIGFGPILLIVANAHLDNGPVDLKQKWGVTFRPPTPKTGI